MAQELKLLGADFQLACEARRGSLDENVYPKVHWMY